MRRIPLLLLPALGACVVDFRGEPRRCTVHDRELEEETVPIVYGEPAVDPERLQAASGAFPHEVLRIEGGCVVRPGAPGWARVRCCPACREAGRRWDRRRAKMGPEREDPP